MVPDLEAVPCGEIPSFFNDNVANIANAMGDYQAMLDAIRDGPVHPILSDVPEDLAERANHLKAFCYFNDASITATCALPAVAKLVEPIKNTRVKALAEALKVSQTKTLAAGIDTIVADLRDHMEKPDAPLPNHSHALVIAIEYGRDPEPNEPGFDWMEGTQALRACLRAAEVASVLASYIRVLGRSARAHSMAATDVNLNRLAVASGFAISRNGEVLNPHLGSRFGLAAVTMDFDIAVDKPLADNVKIRPKPHDPYRKRRYVDGAHPFETLKRVDEPTTYIDEPNVPRVPKRADMFARAQFGDMGRKNQSAATAGKYVLKAAPSSAQRRALGAFTALATGEVAKEKQRLDPTLAAENIKAVSNFLGIDAVGISRCPSWTWYSHDARGGPIDPPHDQAISMIVDQGFETMEGASGDDWISVAQSMRAYLRFALLGGVVANHIRRLGYSAKAHTVIDGEVLQPPLLLLSGLGEVSRIGEVILNPFLGPRLKSGVVTTDLPLAHDKPIDFGLQRFCEGCNKCARECPSGAITVGPKTMFNGYEIWKSDSQKCATYRITTEGGAMCGRCMKTCPWNLEGLFAEAPFRWAAMNIPAVAPALAKLDDRLGRGGLNPVKKWWWDLERGADGHYEPTEKPVNHRDLQPDLVVKPEDQTLAVYPAPLAPPPWPFPFPMNREAGIEAYQAMVTAREYKARLEAGDKSVLHRYEIRGDAPVLPVLIESAEKRAPGITVYTLRDPDGRDLPPWEAGAHLDIVVAPEFLRQYSMCGDPADRSCYQIAVLREDLGRGGSALMHRIFTTGRRIFISKPINHFPLHEDAGKSWFFGGGIGVTPMVAMAHEAAAKGLDFALHYSVKREGDAVFDDLFQSAPWGGHATTHVSTKNRADLSAILAGLSPKDRVYACGPDVYMSAVRDAAVAAGLSEERMHVEYFAVPEQEELESHPFDLHLAKSDVTLHIPADRSATDVLAENGINVDVKCSDGICGVCRCGLVSGEVQHRDFVLSKGQRENSIILCQSRGAKDGETVTIDL